MSLSPAFLDELRARTSLSALVGKSVKLQRAGKEFRACCPFHNEKSPSFYVNDDKGFYHCFGCGAHGDAIRWMTDQRGLPFIDAVKELAAAAGLDMPEQDRRQAERDRRAKGLREAMEDAQKWFVEQLHGLEGAEARAMLERRGIRPETARAFGMGYAPDSRGKLRQALSEYGDAMLVEAGLLIAVDGKEPYDRFRGRLMIPIRDVRGRVIAFGGRIIGDGEPKYLNSPETPLFDKGRNLFNLDRAQAAARKADRVIAVEGYMDVIALAQAGFDEAVAPLGTAMTEHQLDRLWRMSDVPLLCFDGDSAGQKAAIRAAHRALPMLQPGRSLAFVTLPDGQDPDDLVRGSGPGAFETLLHEARPLVEAIWQNEMRAAPLKTPEERAGLGSRLRALAQEIHDSDVRKEYLATFNRLVWDLFHPERPSGSFVKFKAPHALQRATADRVMAIAQHGIAQATFIPALVAGFLRHPWMIAPLAEIFSDIEMNSKKLRLIREAMFRETLSTPDLDSESLRERLKADALGPVVTRLDQITLAFSFLSSGTPRTTAARDLAAVAEALVMKPRLDSQISFQKEEFNQSSDDASYQRLEELLKQKHAIDHAFLEAMRPADDVDLEIS